MAGALLQQGNVERNPVHQVGIDPKIKIGLALTACCAGKMEDGVRAGKQLGLVGHQSAKVPTTHSAPAGLRRCP